MLQSSLENSYSMHNGARTAHSVTVICARIVEYLHPILSKKKFRLARIREPFWIAKMKKIIIIALMRNVLSIMVETISWNWFVRPDSRWRWMEAAGPIVHSHHFLVSYDGVEVHYFGLNEDDPISSSNNN